LPWLPWYAPRARPGLAWKRFLTGEWIIELTNARQRRIIHYWLTILWVTVGLAVWVVFRNALWFVGLMSLYAIWISHLAGWAAETPVESEHELEAAE
jgi:hypothetical protein